MFIPNILAQELTKSADKYWNKSLLKIQKLLTKGLFWYSEKSKFEPLQATNHPPPFFGNCLLCWSVITPRRRPKCPCSRTSCNNRGSNSHKEINLNLKISLNKAIISLFQFEGTLCRPRRVRFYVKTICSSTQAFFFCIVYVTSCWRKPFFDTACFQPGTLFPKLEA